MLMNIFKSNKAYRNLVGGEAISYLGDVLFYPIMLILASQSSNVGLMTGLVTISETLPRFIIFFIISKMENVKNRFYFLCTTYVIRFGIYALIALLLTNQTDVVLLVILLFNIVSDIIGNLVTHVRIQYATDISQDIAKEGELETTFSQMTGISQVVQNASQLIGFAIGGTLLFIMGPVQIALINAFTFLLGMFLIALSSNVFRNYDAKKQIDYSQKPSQRLNIKLVLESKKLMWYIFLAGVLNMMMSMMLLFNNLYANQLQIGGSYGTYVFVMMMVMTLGMITGGLIMSTKQLKVSFDLVMTLIFSIACLYFTTLLFGQSLLLIGIAFIMMTFAGIAQPLFLGQILSVIGTDKIASIAVTINVLMQLMTPVFVFFIALLLQVVSVTVLTEIGIACFVLLACTLVTMYVIAKRKQCLQPKSI